MGRRPASPHQGRPGGPFVATAAVAAAAAVSQLSTARPCAGSWAQCAFEVALWPIHRSCPTCVGTEQLPGPAHALPTEPGMRPAPWVLAGCFGRAMLSAVTLSPIRHWWLPFCQSFGISWAQVMSLMSMEAGYLPTVTPKDLTNQELQSS